MDKLIRRMLREGITDTNKVKLVSKTDKGNRLFKMLKTAKFQHYDSPKGKLDNFIHGEDDRKRLVSKLSKEDKKIYNKWIITDEGKESIELFNSFDDNYTIDKYGDRLECNKNFPGLKFPLSNYKTNVKDCLVNIIVDEKHISEKDFKNYDKIIHMVRDFFIENDDIDFNEDYRPDYNAEKIYNEYKDSFK